MRKGLEHVTSMVAWRASIFGNTQNPNECNPEIVALGDPALSRGVGLDYLQMFFLAALAL